MQWRFYRLTESFDGMLELYEVIFDKYTGFLTDSELSHLLDRAKKSLGSQLFGKDGRRS